MPRPKKVLPDGEHCNIIQMVLPDMVSQQALKKIASQERCDVFRAKRQVDRKGTWMQRGSAVKHVLGNAHLDAAATAMAASQPAAADVNRLEEPYSDLSDAYINPDAADMAAPEHHIGLFDPIFDAGRTR